MNLSALLAAGDEGPDGEGDYINLDKPNQRSASGQKLAGTASHVGLCKGGSFNAGSSRSPPVRPIDRVQSGPGSRITKLKSSCPSTTESMLRDEIKALKNQIKTQQDVIQSKDEEIALLKSTSYRSSWTPSSSSSATTGAVNNNRGASSTSSPNTTNSGNSANYNQYVNNAEAERNALIVAQQQQQQGQSRLMEQLMQLNYSIPQNQSSFEQQLQVLQLLRSNPQWVQAMEQQQQEQQLRWYRDWNAYSGQS